MNMSKPYQSFDFFSEQKIKPGEMLACTLVKKNANKLRPASPVPAKSFVLKNLKVKTKINKLNLFNQNQFKLR